MSEYLNNENQTNNQTGEQNAAQSAPQAQPQQQSWSNTGSWTTGSQQTQYQNQTQNQSYQNQAYNPYGQGYSAYTAPQPQQKPKKEKKAGISAALVACLLVGCLVLGAGAGVGGALLVSSFDRTIAQTDQADPSVVGDPAETTNQTVTTPDGGVATFNKSEGTTVVIDRTGIGSANGVTKSFTEVVAAVKDSVVEITTETVVRGSRFSQYVTSGAGSGVIIAKEGYVITNHHVISDADNIIVRTTDGTEYTATLVGSDAASDVAVLKIDPAGAALTVATLGDSSKLLVGEDAIAIGNPLGSLGGTVTNGIISALDREITIDGESMRLLQTNAAVNPGNSGGGLFNLAGELIGIVNAKSSGEDVEGLGFAIPINTAEEIAAQLIEYGYVRGRVDIGLSLIDITNMFDLFAYGLSTPGVYVYESPYNDQIKSGDRIQAVNGVAVTSAAEVKAAYRDCAVGDVIKVSIVRGNKVIEVDVTLRELVPTSTGVEFETDANK
ncbi:MAG: trypsin-like peptidase domain-containing protein [Clostridia bacterium]|nr:trypsin-like peptidase domain-containing protein [Clostridia bacterium]